MIKAPEYVSAIKPYIPGKPIEELERELGIKDTIKLASNENPLGPSPLALRDLESKIETLNRYPDGEGYYLKNTLSGMLGVEGDELILGNGSNELIDIAVSTFFTSKNNAVMADPSFVVYQMSITSSGGRAITVPLKDYKHDLDAMLKAVTKETKLVFIANPNNPTGTIAASDELDLFMKQIPDDVLVIVDEAYYEYVSDPSYPDTLRYQKAGKNILVLRTFSKIYGLAGLRIGYGIAKKNIIKEMNKIRNPFNTNSMAQAAALRALEDREHLKKSLAINSQGREYLYNQLDKMGVEYIPSEANFIYILLKRDTGEVYEELLKKGVIIRPMGKHSVRVTIGLPEENREFIRKFREVL